VLSIRVAELTQAAQERVDRGVRWLGPNHLGGLRNCSQDTDPVDPAPGLGAGDAGRHEGPDGEAFDESAPVHQTITSSVRSRNDGFRRPRPAGSFASAANASAQRPAEPGRWNGSLSVDISISFNVPPHVS
jgi:hypothetical protein